MQRGDEKSVSVLPEHAELLHAGCLIGLCHDAQVDRVQRKLREYTGKDRRNAELCVKEARAKTREHADNYGNQQRRPGRHPGKQEHYRDRAAGRERTVNGHIGYIQQSEGYKHAQRHESPYYALRNGSRHS